MPTLVQVPCVFWHCSQDWLGNEAAGAAVYSPLITLLSVTWETEAQRSSSAQVMQPSVWGGESPRILSGTQNPASTTGFCPLTGTL